MADNTVTIPIQRFEELLDIETRVNVAVERIAHDEYISTMDILWILGTEMALDVANDMQKKIDESTAKLHEELFGKSTNMEE